MSFLVTLPYLVQSILMLGHDVMATVQEAHAFLSYLRMMKLN
jgi:hypothetical protein